MKQKFRRGADSAASAFRRYALMGIDRRQLNVLDAYECIRNMCISDSAALDMISVYDTLRLLRVSGREECVATVKAVYFVGRGRRQRKNDVTFRVRRIAYEKHCDERTVYRWLQYAARLYDMIRKNQI